MSDVIEEDLLEPPEVAWNPLTKRWISKRGITFRRLQTRLIASQAKTTQRKLRVAEALESPKHEQRPKKRYRSPSPPPQMHHAPKESRPPPRQQQQTEPHPPPLKALTGVDEQTARFWRQNGFAIH